MLSLEQRIYLIECWTDFCYIITKFNEKFPNSYVSGMSVQKLKLRYRVELCTENGANIFFCIFFDFNVEKDFLITEMGVSDEAKNIIPLKFLRKIKNFIFFLL
jgi:hypothetical protein